MPGMPFPRPLRKMKVLPLPSVPSEQFAKTFCTHVMAPAGTPVSVNRRVNQLLSEEFWNDSVPLPEFGTPNVNVVPGTWVQWPSQIGSLMIMVGSATEFANAATPNISTATHANNRKRNFIKAP